MLIPEAELPASSPPPRRNVPKVPTAVAQAGPRACEPAGSTRLPNFRPTRSFS